MKKRHAALAIAAAFGLAMMPAASFANHKKGHKSKAAAPAATTKVCKGKDAKGHKVKWSCGVDDTCCNGGGKTSCGAPVVGCLE